MSSEISKPIPARRTEAEKRRAQRKASRDAIPNIMRQGRFTPWLYLLPALIVMTVYIVYPMITTVWLSFQNRTGTQSASTLCVEGRPCWGIFENYRYALSSEINFNSLQTFWNTFWVSSFGNNIKWTLFMVTGVVIIGLAFAVLTDRVKYEALAKSLIFMPMAISFVGAGVIWKFVYDYRTGDDQIGLLNAIINGLGGQPVSWITTINLNTIMLIVVGIWMWTGFSMTVLSASLKSVPTEIIEAARVDGANEWKVFTSIMVPIIMPTIIVIITTMIINVLKLFDIVYVMTGGNFGTEVLATRMYTEMYTNFNVGRGTAVAVVLIVIILPFIYLNIKRFLEQEAWR